MEKIKYVTNYGCITGIYFKRILNTIISVGELNKRDVSVLDFGCGHGFLKKILSNKNVINYDIVEHLSDVSDWREVDFDVIVANEVFYSFNQNQLNELILEFKEKNNRLELIVGISRQSLLNNIGKVVLGHKDAHEGTILGPEEELMVIKRYMRVVKQKSVFSLMDIYSLVFK